jgi:phosphatidylserine/phosphatidylglycerophosphate/cardiolipin synthase-like enzyme
MRWLEMLKCGRGVGKFILGELNSVGRVVVVSPWLSRETVELLKELNRRADVVLVTTDDVENRSHAEALAVLQGLSRETKASRRESEILAGVLLIFMSVLLALRLLWFLLGALIGAIILIHGLRGKSHTYLFDVTVLPRSVNLHAKLIIIPEKNLVGVGSVNFTSAGLNTNIECWAWLKGEEYVREAMKLVEELKAHVNH